MAQIVTHTYTRVRALNVALPDPPLGVGIRAGKPKADRAIRKRKAATYQAPSGLGTGPIGSGMSTPYGVLICTWGT